MSDRPELVVDVTPQSRVFSRQNAEAVNLGPVCHGIAQLVAGVVNRKNGANPIIRQISLNVGRRAYGGSSVDATNGSGYKFGANLYEKDSDRYRTSTKNGRY